MVLLLQIVGSLLILVIVIRLFLRWRSKRLSLGEFLLWSLLWLVILAVVLFPGITFIPANWLGISRGVDLLVYSSIILLFLLVYKLFAKTEEIEQELTALVRKLAIRELNKELNKKSANTSKKPKKRKT